MLEPPIAVTVRFKNYRPGQVLAFLPLFERVDAHAVRFVASDMVQASEILAFITSYRPDLEP